MEKRPLPWRGCPLESDLALWSRLWTTVDTAGCRPGLLPEINEWSVGAVNRVLARQLCPSDRGHRIVMVDFVGLRLVVVAPRRIGADYQEIGCGANPLMAGTGRQDDDVARRQLKGAALGAAEPYRNPTAGDPEHLVGRRMEMLERIDAVAP